MYQSLMNDNVTLETSAELLCYGFFFPGKSLHLRCNREQIIKQGIEMLHNLLVSGLHGVCIKIHREFCFNDFITVIRASMLVNVMFNINLGTIILLADLHLGKLNN